MTGHRFTKATAIGVVAMGIIHIVATFTPLINSGLDILPSGKRLAIIYFSIMCGMLLVFGGAMILLLKDKVREHTFLRIPYNMTKGVILLSGISAATLMMGNPFAWMIFAIAILLTLSK